VTQDEKGLYGDDTTDSLSDQGLNDRRGRQPAIVAISVKVSFFPPPLFGVHDKDAPIFSGARPKRLKHQKSAEAAIFGVQPRR
jgi:hypothetical protein